MLRDIFMFYCSWGEKSNYLTMSRSQFLRFARDCLLMGGEGLDATSLSLIFDRVSHGLAQLCRG